MQHLTPVGLSKDGKTLVLVSNSGEEYAVPVDHRLRAALRGDHARLGQLEMKMESALRPRDIQARIRGGESAEDVAAAAQTTVDAIMGFAAPVLAERAHIAESAQKSSIRRRSTETSTAVGTLDQASRRHLSDVGVRADDVEWDAWRREDGRWTLVAQYAVGGAPRRAEFTYDQPGRYVVADNQEARLLTGESSMAPETGTPGRRLSAVPSDRGVDDELPLGDDAIELVRDRALDPAADHGDADWIARTDEEAEDESAAEHHDETAEEAGATGAAADPEPAEVAEKPARKGRSSVPSWDEIMFGGGKGE
ncbi:hypothetical protein ACVW00_002354 [Marmoricola sp. URHA0025 HA25]